MIRPAVLGLLLAAAGPALTAPDEGLLGKGRGYPVCPVHTQPVREDCLVGGLSNFDRLSPARVVPKGAAVRELRRAPKEAPITWRTGIPPAPVSEPKSIDDFLAENRNTGLLVLKDDLILAERYDGKDDVAVLGAKTIGQRGPGGADSVSTFRTRERPAGTKFDYSSAETQVLGLVLRAAVMQPLTQYLSEKIWQPMGAEADATWQVDASGIETGYMGINARLRDFGRFGLLLAHDGRVGDRQVIPAEWVKAATSSSSTPRSTTTARRPAAASSASSSARSDRFRST